MNLVLNSEMCFYRVHRMENSRLEQVVVVATEAAETGVVVEAVGKTDQHLGILGVVAGGVPWVWEQLVVEHRQIQGRRPKVVEDRMEVLQHRRICTIALW